MDTIWKVLGVIGVLILAAIASGIGKEVGRSAVKKYASDRNDGAVEEALRQAAGQINRGLPMMVDQYTRMDSTVPGPGKKLTYLYTLVSVNSADVSQQQLQDALGTSVRNGVCTNRDMQFLVNSGVQFVYLYRGGDGGVIGDVVVNPQDCR